MQFSTTQCIEPLSQSALNFKPARLALPEAPLPNSHRRDACILQDRPARLALRGGLRPGAPARLLAAWPSGRLAARKFYTCLFRAPSIKHACMRMASFSSVPVRCQSLRQDVSRSEQTPHQRRPTSHVRIRGKSIAWHTRGSTSPPCGGRRQGRTGASWQETGADGAASLPRPASAPRPRRAPRGRSWRAPQPGPPGSRSAGRPKPRPRVSCSQASQSDADMAKPGSEVHEEHAPIFLLAWAARQPGSQAARHFLHRAFNMNLCEQTHEGSSNTQGEEAGFHRMGADFPH